MGCQGNSTRLMTRRGTKTRGGAKVQAVRKFLSTEPLTVQAMARFQRGQANKKDLKHLKYVFGGAYLQNMLTTR